MLSGPQLRAVISAASMLIFLPSVALPYSDGPDGPHKERIQDREVAPRLAPVCAQQEIKIITLIEDHGAAADMAPNQLAAAGLAMLRARMLCYAGEVEEAVAVFRTTMKILVSFAAFNASLAQTLSSPPFRGPVEGAEDFWTVLTMTPDGAWGAATDDAINRAIAGAIRNCKKMSQRELGCGAVFTSIRAGWSLGIRCGSENIIVAEKDLKDAVRAAISREIELRQLYVPDMPPCVRIVTVDPHGGIVVPKPEYSGRPTLPTGEAAARQQPSGRTRDPSESPSGLR